jgi:hypothetical protein
MLIANTSLSKSLGAAVMRKIKIDRQQIKTVVLLIMHGFSGLYSPRVAVFIFVSIQQPIQAPCNFDTDVRDSSGYNEN